MPRMFTSSQARTLLGMGPKQKQSLWDEDETEGDEWGDSVATPNQAKALTNCGIMDASKLSYTEASELMSALMRRMNEGLCSLRQIAWLRAEGKPWDEARGATFQEVNRMLGGGQRTRR